MSNNVIEGLKAVIAGAVGLAGSVVAAGGILVAAVVAMIFLFMVCCCGSWVYTVEATRSDRIKAEQMRLDRMDQEVRRGR